MSDAKPKDGERQRAHRGSGTIRTRKDGRMEKRVSLGVDEQGRRIRVSVYGANLNELHKNARDAIRKFNAAKLASNRDRGTLADFFANETDGWLTLKETEVGERTIRNYRNDWEKYVEPELGSLRLNPETLTVDVVQLWHNRLVKNHGAYTANRAKDLLANVLMDSRAMQATNPARLVRSAKHTKPPIEILTAAELQLFIPAVRRTRLRNLILTALNTGLRHGEATALHWTDVKLYDEPAEGEDHGEIRVRRAAVKTEDGLKVVPSPKSSSGYRTIGLTPEGAQLFRDQKELLEIEGLGKSRLVFPTSTGGLQPVENTARAMRGLLDSLNPRLMEWVYERRQELRDAGLTMRQARQQARREAMQLPELEDLLDVKYVTFHDLRHTFASIMIAAGMDAARLAVILGHSDAAFTMRTYVQFFEQAKRLPMPRVSTFVPGPITEIGGQNRGSNAKVANSQKGARPETLS